MKPGYSGLIKQHRNLSYDVPWRWVWHIKTTKKCKFLVWMICHNVLPTNELRWHKGLSLDSSCLCCHQHAESSLHCLRDCYPSWRIWCHLGFVSDVRFLADNPGQWLTGYAKNDKSCLSFATLWWLWIIRNKAVIEQALWTDSELVHRIHGTMEDFKILLEHDTATTRQVLLVGWSPPMVGSVKINVDRSSLGNPGPPCFGGLIRDAQGEWVARFKGSIGVSQILLAELIAIYHGLLLAWQKGFREVGCESDYMEAVRLVNEDWEEFQVVGSVIAYIRHMKGRSWNMQLVHVYHEMNACADFLANSGVGCSSKFELLSTPPAWLSSLLLAYALRVLFDRE